MITEKFLEHKLCCISIEFGIGETFFLTTHVPLFLYWNVVLKASQVWTDPIVSVLSRMAMEFGIVTWPYFCLRMSRWSPHRNPFFRSQMWHELSLKNCVMLKEQWRPPWRLEIIGTVLGDWKQFVESSDFIYFWFLAKDTERTIIDWWSPRISLSWSLANRQCFAREMQKRKMRQMLIRTQTLKFLLQIITIMARI